MSYTLSEYAKKVLAEREILLEWLERTLREPVLRRPRSGRFLAGAALPGYSRVRGARVARGGQRRDSTGSCGERIF
jgi:hypothetical protein